MELVIDQVIQKVPFLAESKNVKKTALSGGITNLNFKVDADGKSYVIRLAMTKFQWGSVVSVIFAVIIAILTGLGISFGSILLSILITGIR